MWSNKLFQAQGETVNTIESNIENATVAVSEGVADLSKVITANRLVDYLSIV